MTFKATRFYRVGLVTTMVLANCGCSFLFGNDGYFRSRSLDYQKAEITAPLALKSGEGSDVAMRELYPIPDVNNADSYEPENLEDVPKPAALLAVNANSGIEVRTQDGQRWLVVSKDAAVLQEDLALFFKSSGIALDAAATQGGVYETQWLKPRAESSQGFWGAFTSILSTTDADKVREKFRVVVTPGDTDQEQRIQVNHQQFDLPEKGAQITQDQWPSATENADLVAAFYDELITYLSDDAVRFRRSSLFSQTLNAQQSATLTRDGNGYPVLVMGKDFALTWVQVGEALKKTDFNVTDKDRVLGVYFLEDPQNADETLQLKLISAEHGVQVAVQVDDDQLAPVGVSERILETLKAEL